ncbi:MAG: hypothetical protein Q9165_001454 [Trypethelium subeluteriae]
MTDILGIIANIVIGTGLVVSQGLSSSVIGSYTYARLRDIKEQVKIIDESLNALESCTSGEDSWSDGRLREELQQCLRTSHNTLQALTRHLIRCKESYSGSLQVEQRAQDFYHRHNKIDVVDLETFLRRAHLALDPDVYATQHVSDATAIARGQSYIAGSTKVTRWKKVLSFLPQNRNAISRLISRSLANPSRDIFLLSCLIYGIALLGFLQHRRYDRYQDTFLRVGVIIGLILGLMSSLQFGNIAGFGIYTPACITGAVTFSAVLHRMLPGWRAGPNDCNNQDSPSPTQSKRDASVIIPLTEVERAQFDKSLMDSMDREKEKGNVQR